MISTFTRADYDQLPEGFPAQLLEGMLVKDPAPTYGHQITLGRVRDALVAVLSSDLVVTAPTDVALDDLNVYQPDIVVLREIPPLEARNVGIPRVVFEVLSPSTADRDRHLKRPHLLAAGVTEVWLVDRDAGTIEVWDASGVRRATGDVPAISYALRGFSLIPDQLFAPPRAE